MVFSLCGSGCTVFHAVEFPVLGGGRRIFGREPRVLICVYVVAYVLAYCFWFPMPWRRCFLCWRLCNRNCYFALFNFLALCSLYLA